MTVQLQTSTRPVIEDEWMPCERSGQATYTPYGKGEIVDENATGTHYRVKYRTGQTRRIKKDNCLDRMKISNPEVNKKYKTIDERHSVSGRKYRGQDDQFKTLGSDEEELKRICKLNKIKYKYGHLNPGHQRMIIGNILRGMVRRGEPVKMTED